MLVGLEWNGLVGMSWIYLLVLFVLVRWFVPCGFGLLVELCEDDDNESENTRDEVYDSPLHTKTDERGSRTR